MIPSTSSLLLFLGGAIVLLVTPGPAVFYIVSRTIGQGRAAGLISASGIAVGTLFHVTAATLGLSALLVSSAHAFRAVQLAGAAYLIFLGLRTLLRHQDDAPGLPESSRSLRRIFGQGVLVNVLNPKSALFFLAFLPQFVDPARGHISAQVLFLGLLFAVMGLCSDSCWALLANQLSGRLRVSHRWRRAQKNISGSALIALGVATAVSGSRTK